jgi:hypothetical protein
MKLYRVHVAKGLIRDRSGVGCDNMQKTSYIQLSYNCKLNHRRSNATPVSLFMGL